MPDLIALIELEGVSPFDISLSGLAFTGWWRANYAGAPWSGTDSAGTSGSHPALTGGADPAAGSTVNGLTPAHFDGDYLRDNVNGIGAYISATGYRVVALVNVGANAAAATNAYQDAAIVCDGGNGAWGIGVNAAEVRAYHAHLGVYTTVAQPLTQGWHMLEMSYDGTTLSLSVDGNEATTATVADLTGFAGDVLLVGCNYNAAARFVGDIAELMICDQPLSSVPTSTFKRYLEARYALDLTWSPKRNIAGATLVLRADVGVTLSSGKVSAWEDQSGVGDSNRNATQGTSANRPGYQASNPSFAARATVDCTMSGSDARFLKTGTWASPTVSSDVTIAIVCRRADSGASNCYLFDALSSPQFGFYELSTHTTHYAYHPGAGNFLSRDADLTSPSAIIIAAKNGETPKLRVNSNSDNATSHTDPGTFTPAGFTIGSYMGSGGYSDFEIAEFCIWLRQLTVVEIKALNAYFARRYDLVIAP